MARNSLAPPPQIHQISISHMLGAFPPAEIRKLPSTLPIHQPHPPPRDPCT
jgi:hypothetical protein